MAERTVIEYKALKHSGGKGIDKIPDGKGLFMFVTKTMKGTSKSWKYLYRFEGKQNTMSFGMFPDVLPKEAREKREDARRLLNDDIDPNQVRKDKTKAAALKKEQELREQEADTNTFEKVAWEYLELSKKGWSDSHYKKVVGRYKKYIFSVLGSMPITKIEKSDTTALINGILKKSDGESYLDTASRIYQKLTCVFNYANDHDYIDRVPMTSKKSLVPAHQQKKMPAITDIKDLGEFLRQVDGYSGNFITECALKLLVYLPIRQGEYRRSQWGEFDLENATWTIPATNRKLSLSEKKDADNLLIIPLSRQAIAILRSLYSLTGSGKYLFSGQGANKDGYISENTLAKVLEKLGNKGKMTPHGIRRVFSTLLNDQGFDHVKVDKQLGHRQKDQVESRYNDAEYMHQRIVMMQHYADYLDALRDGAEVIPIKRKA